MARAIFSFEASGLEWLQGSGDMFDTSQTLGSDYLKIDSGNTSNFTVSKAAFARDGIEAGQTSDYVKMSHGVPRFLGEAVVLNMRVEVGRENFGTLPEQALGRGSDGDVTEMTILASPGGIIIRKREAGEPPFTIIGYYSLLGYMSDHQVVHIRATGRDVFLLIIKSAYWTSVSNMGLTLGTVEQRLYPYIPETEYHASYITVTPSVEQRSSLGTGVEIITPMPVHRVPWYMSSWGWIAPAGVALIAVLLWYSAIKARSR